MTITSTITFSGKEFACNAGGAGDTGLTPGSGRSPGEENGNPLQYFCLKNPMDRETWAIVHGVTKSQTRLKQLSIHALYLLLWAQVPQKKWTSPQSRQKTLKCSTWVQSQK